MRDTVTLDMASFLDFSQCDCKFLVKLKQNLDSMA